MNCPVCGKASRELALRFVACTEGHYSYKYARGVSQTVIGGETFTFNYDDSIEHQIQVAVAAEWAAKVASIAYRLSVLKEVAA